MKNLIILLVVVLTSKLSAQTNQIQSSGNVGIGTTSPTDLLEVNTGNSRRGITIKGDGEQNVVNDLLFTVNTRPVFNLNQPHTWHISHRKDGYFSNNTVGESSLEFYADRSSDYLAPLSFKSNGDVILVSSKGAITGNVGIGVTNPAGKLHIAAPLDGSSSIRIGSASAGNKNVPLGSSPGGYNIDFHTWRDVVPDQIGARIRAERVNNHQNNNALVQSMDLAFYTSIGGVQSDLTEKLRIKSDGSVCIGTLDSRGSKLAVAGGVIAESIKVKLQGNWPDYVFDSTYKLEELKAIERFIKMNKHLPGIPSAKEVSANGLDIGEMNGKLLQKIEELTLHIIEQSKRIERLEARKVK